MLARLKELFRPAHDVAEPRLIRAFALPDEPLTKDGVAPNPIEGGWRIESDAARTIPLFEIPDPDVENCVLTFRARMRAEYLDGRAYLELRCRVPGRQPYVDKGIELELDGTTDWRPTASRFVVPAGERPDVIRLDVVLESAGTVWLKDVELWATPLPQ